MVQHNLKHNSFLRQISCIPTKTRNDKALNQDGLLINRHRIFSIASILHNFQGIITQGRNQDLNLTKQKYEILTGHIRIVAKNVIK